MALLDYTGADPGNPRAGDVFTAVDEINTIVDGIDKTNPAAIASVHDMLNGRLMQFQRHVLTEHVNSSRHSGAAETEW
jgi:hypothetical protein